MIFWRVRDHETHCTFHVSDFIKPAYGRRHSVINVKNIVAKSVTDRLVPLEQASILAKALTAAGIDHETYLFPWANHSFDVYWGSIATQVARAKVVAFLEKHG